SSGGVASGIQVRVVARSRSGGGMWTMRVRPVLSDVSPEVVKVTGAPVASTACSTPLLGTCTGTSTTTDDTAAGGIAGPGAGAGRLCCVVLGPCCAGFAAGFGTTG